MVFTGIAARPTAIAWYRTAARAVARELCNPQLHRCLLLRRVLKSRFWVRQRRLLQTHLLVLPPRMALVVQAMAIQSVVTGYKVAVAPCTGYVSKPNGISAKVTKLIVPIQYCGNTTSHCGDGCQSGPCSGPVVVHAPGPSPAPANPNPGKLMIVGQSGVPAMHAGLMPNGRVIFLDKVENYTQIKLSDGQYAYSAEYDPATNKVVGLQYKVKQSYYSQGRSTNGSIRPTPSALVELFCLMAAGSLLEEMLRLTLSTPLSAMASLLSAISTDLQVMQILTVKLGVSQATNFQVPVGTHRHRPWAMAPSS